MNSASPGDARRARCSDSIQIRLQRTRHGDSGLQSFREPPRDVRRLRWGVESICTQLSELGVPIAPSTYYDQARRDPSRRELRDEELKEHIRRGQAIRA